MVEETRWLHVDFHVYYSLGEVQTPARNASRPQLANPRMAAAADFWKLTCIVANNQPATTTSHPQPKQHHRRAQHVRLQPHNHGPGQANHHTRLLDNAHKPLQDRQRAALITSGGQIQHHTTSISSRRRHSTKRARRSQPEWAGKHSRDCGPAGHDEDGDPGVHEHPRERGEQDADSAHFGR